MFDEKPRQSEDITGRVESTAENQNTTGQKDTSEIKRRDVMKKGAAVGVAGASGVGLSSTASAEKMDDREQIQFDVGDSPQQKLDKHGLLVGSGQTRTGQEVINKVSEELQLDIPSPAEFMRQASEVQAYSRSSAETGIFHSLIRGLFGGGNRNQDSERLEAHFRKSIEGATLELVFNEAHEPAMAVYPDEGETRVYYKDMDGTYASQSGPCGESWCGGSCPYGPITVQVRYWTYYSNGKCQMHGDCLGCR